MNSALCPRLNERIADIVKGLSFTVSDSAPSTYSELVSRGSDSLVIWSGGSDLSIYGDRAINYGFRAWHDSLHLSLGADFTLDGELLVAREQARTLGDDIGDFLIAEVKGQAEYFSKNGCFPVDQYSFVKDYMGLR